MARLERTYGERRWQGRREPVAVLVGTILSQNTNSANSQAGFRRLRERFPTWQQVADTPLGSIARCIRVSGLSKIKAPRIRSILRQIRAERGRISLNFLRDLPPQEAFKYLVRFDGVGPKTAWCVLMFSFGKNVFPVDTHIHRIAFRLGLLDGKVLPEKAHELLKPLIAPKDRYAMHVLLIAHGRQTCLARKPKCDQCCILQFCGHDRARLAANMER